MCPGWLQDLDGRFFLKKDREYQGNVDDDHNDDDDDDDDIQAGDSVLNRDLLPVRVIGVFSHPEGSDSLYSFGSEHPEGPVFTADHQFISGSGVPAVVDLEHLYEEDPLMVLQDVEEITEHTKIMKERVY